ncbi:MAG: DMT family transporter [Maritimibacter sp.]
MGVMLKLAAVAAFTCMGALIKATDGRVPAGEVVFFRSLFAIPIMLLWLGVMGQLRAGIRTERPLAHMVRGLIGTTAMGLGFAGLLLLPLPDVTALQYAMPIFVVIFSAVFLGEGIRLFRVSAVIIGLVGVLIVLWPRLTGLTGLTSGGLSEREAFGAVIVLVGAMIAAVAQLIVRKLVETERPVTVALYFAFSSTTISLFSIPFGWVWPSTFDAGLLIGAGAIGGLAQGLMSTSYRYAPASTLAPFDYSSMIFAVVIGYVFFLEVPTMTTLMGAALVILAGIVIVLRERHLAKGQARV